MYEKLKMLSYSSIELLRTCPRKYQLTKLSEVSPRDITIHTAFGSSLGAGIQSLLSNTSIDTALFAAFAAWHIDLDECDTKTDKSFTSVHNALLQFKSTQYPTISQEYELLTLPNGLPAIELSASIELPDGFKYRLYIDAVLRRKSDGMLTVLELKTTGSSWVNASSYKNSGQALGYSVVLDALAKELNTSVAHVYGVVSFYSFFTMTPKGEHPISICMGTACYVRGAEKVLDEFKHHLKIQVGETTADGKFSLACLRCVGACGLAPVVMVGEKVYGRVAPDGVKAILEEYSA